MTCVLQLSSAWPERIYIYIFRVVSSTVAARTKPRALLFDDGCGAGRYQWLGFALCRTRGVQCTTWTTPCQEQCTQVGFISNVHRWDLYLAYTGGIYIWYTQVGFICNVHRMDLYLVDTGGIYI